MKCFYLILVLLFGSLPLQQSKSKFEERVGGALDLLILRGRVDAMEIEEIDGSNARVKLTLTMELVNAGSRPIILLDKQPTFPGARLAKTTEDFAKGNLLNSTYAGASINLSPEWSDLRKALDQPMPPTGLTRMLRPQESWVLKVERDLIFDSAPSRYPRQKDLKEVMDASPVMLKVICDVWPFNIEPNADTKLPFGRQLQYRWQSVGKLWLDDLLSEPILLDFKSFS